MKLENEVILSPDGSRIFNAKKDKSGILLPKGHIISDERAAELGLTKSAAKAEDKAAKAKAEDKAAK